MERIEFLAQQEQIRRDEEQAARDRRHARPITADAEVQVEPQPAIVHVDFQPVRSNDSTHSESESSVKSDDEWNNTSADYDNDKADTHPRYEGLGCILSLAGRIFLLHSVSVSAVTRTAPAHSRS